MTSRLRERTDGLYLNLGMRGRTIMRRTKRGNLYFVDVASEHLICRARTGDDGARRQLLRVIADQAVPLGDTPNPIQNLIQVAFSKAARSPEPEKELLKQLGFRVVGRPPAVLSPEQQLEIINLASDLHIENWRKGNGIRMSKQCKGGAKRIAKSIGITTQGLDKILDRWVVAVEVYAEWRRNEAE